jgi:hypothetical protein
VIPPELAEAAAGHGPSFLFALVLLYELRDIRKSRRQEREGWQEVLQNNTEAMRDLKREVQRLRPRQPARTDGGKDE